MDRPSRSDGPSEPDAPQQSGKPRAAGQRVEGRINLEVNQYGRPVVESRLHPVECLVLFSQSYMNDRQPERLHVGLLRPPLEFLQRLALNSSGDTSKPAS